MELNWTLPDLTSEDFTSIITWVTIWAFGLVVMVAPTGMYIWQSWQHSLERVEFLRRIEADREILSDFMKMQTSANIQLATALSDMSKKKRKTG